MYTLVEEVLLDVGMLVAPVALYILMRRYLISVPDPRLQGYTAAGWNYHLKRAWAWFCLYRQKNILSTSTVTKQHLPVFASDEEIRQEKPKKILRDKSMDSMSMYGVDRKGNCLLVKIVRKFPRQAEVWLYLTLADGSVYELPEHPDTTIATINDKDFQAGNLKFTQIEAMRKWRITYNGMLRKGPLNKWSNVRDEEKLEHVRLNFIWTACSTSCDAREVWSRKLLSDALAKEHWRSGNWFSIVSFEPPGYDQFGVLDGLVQLGDQEEGTRLYLRGGRERRWGEVQEESLQRSIKLQGVTSNGAFFCIKTTCRKEGMTHAKWGIVRSSTGKVDSLTSCDLSLEDVAHFKNLPRQLVVRFTAGAHSYIVSMQFQENSGATLYSGNPWRLQTYLRKFQFGMNGIQGTGIAEFSYKFRGESPVPKLSPIGLLSAGHWEVREGTPPMVCDLHDHAAQVESLAGGKGVSLALLASLKDKKFIVPAGFSITTTAYEKHLKSSSNLQNCIQNIKDTATGHNKCDIKDACEKTVTAFEDIEPCNEVKIAIENYLQRFSPNTIFAVRSSAVGEDSEDLSCAGQNLSILGVKCKGVSNAVSKCWASLFSEHSVEYRRRNGQVLDPNMGVVVQEMVPAETAGVLFTRHPFSGNPSQLVVTANYGLGESVVSALVEPDTVIINRSSKDKLTIHDIKLGSKQEGIILSQDGEGTENSKFTEEDQQKLCLTEEQVLALAEVGVKLENLFGSARDIEWAFIKDQLYLLQARPITALDAWTDFELQHEMDSPIITDTEALTFANTGEVLPGATKPLTQTILARILDYEIQQECMKRNEDERCVSNQYQSIICTTSHHITLNIINTLLSNNDKTVSLPNKVMDLAVFGHLVTDAKLHKLGTDRFGVLSRIGKVLKIFDMVKDCMTATREAKNARQTLRQLSLKAEDHLTSASLFAEINKQMPLLLRAAKSHGHMSRTSVFTQVAAMTVLTESKQELHTEHFTDISLLLSSCSDVVSADIPTQLRELAAIIAEEDSEYFCTASPSEALNWIQTESVASAKFRAFLHAHGHRSIREFEFHTMTWGMQPENLIITLQALVRSPHPGPDNTTNLSVAEACQLLKSPTKEGTRRALKFILPYCRTAVARREQSKSTLISALQTFRLGFRQLSHLLVKEGKLPEADLLFYMTHYEIAKLVNQSDSVILSKASRRKRLWNTWESLKYTEITHGVPSPLQDHEHPVGEGLQKLQATPVCSGVVLGRACVVAELSQTSEIIQGDILITHSTDIGWSPYFPLLAGIVTELGGLISHGAVVAREYGLPCIVGATNSTYLFKTGDLVRLNGGTGSLEKISEEPLHT